MDISAPARKILMKFEDFLKICGENSNFMKSEKNKSSVPEDQYTFLSYHPHSFLE
jgi:hypothetical protein